MERAQHKAFVILTLVFHEEDGAWVGVCQELSTSTYASTFEAARSELIELVELHLNELEDVGERARFFAEHNIKLYTDDAPKVVQRSVVVDGDVVDVHRVEVPA
jgi:predicted RNase H-like HicB family nuclease